MDAADAVVLGNIQALWEEIDPIPDDLVSMVDFALDVAGPDTEFLRPGTRYALAAARGDEQTRLITFEGTSLTIMINLSVNTDNTVRVDGWIVPAGSHQVELRTTTGVLPVSSSTTGRFAYESVRRGLAQLSVYHNGLVSTPSILL